MEFKEFDKIPRLHRAAVVTEKIDGTNAQVQVEQVPGLKHEDMEAFEKEHGVPLVYTYLGDVMMGIYAGSRNRRITPQSDNFGFAKWVMDNHAELVTLGPGTHFGEWWGAGIQRGYGFGAPGASKEKRFSLFNVGRWHDAHGTNQLGEKTTQAPECCYVVPILLTTPSFSSLAVEMALNELKTNGSKAAKGFMQPEGIVIWHEAAKQLFKVTLEKDQEWKGKR